MEKLKRLTPWLMLWLVACGGGGNQSAGLNVGGSVQGFVIPTGSKAVALSLSSDPIFRLSEASISGATFNLNLPDLPDVDALGPVFEAPTNCTGVTVQPANAEAVWVGSSLEISGLPAGELVAKSGGQVARWVYAEGALTVSGTLFCPAALQTRARPRIGNGTQYNLNLVQGWNLVLTDANETSFSNAPLTTPVTWGVTTSNDLVAAKGTDTGSTGSRLKGTLGAPGYGLVMKIEKPGTGQSNDLISTPTAASGADGSFDISLPSTIKDELLGTATALKGAGCQGTPTVNNPSALLGQLTVSVYRGNTAIGKTFLVSYSSTVGWWYASSALSISGLEKCGSGDEAFITQYSLNLQAGWNLVQRLEDSLLKTTSWKNLGSISSGEKWFTRIEDLGVGVTPGPFGGLDAGSTATRMHGKLGGWTDTLAASLKLESDAGVSLITGPLSAAGEFDLNLPATIESTSFEPLDLTQGCGAGVTSTPANPTGVKASLEPDRDGTPLGVIAVGGRGFSVHWVYASSAVTVTGQENCPSGDGAGEEHDYNVNFEPGWNLLIETVTLKNDNETIQHSSGALPADSQWFFEADKEAGLPDTGSTSSTLSGSLGAAFANNSLHLTVGGQTILNTALGVNGEVTASLPAAVATSALKVLNPARADCTGVITLTPTTSKYGALSLEIWNKTVFKSPVEITNEDSDGSLEKLSWWYLELPTTVSGTQSCAGLVDNTFKYDLNLQTGWNLVLEHEEVEPTGERNTKFSTVSAAPNGTRWGSN
jgi:hypothetical protein